MSAPKVIIQIIVLGGQIFGKALLEAGRQAVKNAKYRPVSESGEAAGLGNANSGSATDVATREHKMTLDEAQLILNVKRGEQMERILQNYEYLFKANSPPAEPPTGKAASIPTHSHYLQSKIVRARERIEAELKLAAEDSTPTETTTTTTPPPPPPSS